MSEATVLKKNSGMGVLAPKIYAHLEKEMFGTIKFKWKTNIQM